MLLALFEQLLPLLHAEAMLLIDDRQAQLGEFDVGLEQRVRADDHLRQSRRRQFLQLRLFARGVRSGQQDRRRSPSFWNSFLK